MSQAAIAKRVGMGQSTVGDWLAAGAYPETARGLHRWYVLVLGMRSSQLCSPAYRYASAWSKQTHQRCARLGEGGQMFDGFAILCKDTGEASCVRKTG